MVSTPSGLFLIVHLLFTFQPRAQVKNSVSVSSPSPWPTPISKWEERTIKGKKIKIICLETWLVIKCFLFSFCYSHQMLIIFQVVVPNFRCQEQKKENHPWPFPSLEEKPGAGKNHSIHFLPYRTLALHQLQIGSVVCGRDLEVKKALLPKLPLSDLSLFCIISISTITKHKCEKKLTFQSIKLFM